MNLMAGLYRPAEGRITIGGYDPHRLDAPSRRKLVGVVPQSVHIFEGTVADNITLGDASIGMEAGVRHISASLVANTARLGQALPA